MQRKKTPPRNKTPKQCAAEINISAERVRRECAKGAPHDRLGPKTIRVSTEEIIEWLQTSAARAMTGGAR